MHHRHDPSDSIDHALEGSAQGIRAVKISFAVLAATTAIQAVIVSFSGSVALLGEALHNASDALTAVPLWLAFSIGRRAPTRRFTYGYGRAEDLAGIVVVLLIALSAALTAWQAIDRLLHPATVHHLPFVMAAAIVGIVGNEAVARYRLTVGRRIGSAALVADGSHARADGITSCAVLIGAVATALGFERADPIVGLVVTAFILVVLVHAARSVGERLMDAVDPELVSSVERVVAGIPGVEECGRVQIRWVGHRLHAAIRIEVSSELSVTGAHDIAEAASHALLHANPSLSEVIVHTDPSGVTGRDPHAVTAHHRREPDSG